VRWRLARSGSLLLVCTAFALASAYLTVRSFASTVEPFSLGTVRASALPAVDGRVDVYVPIVDWGVRASPYEAPVALELRFRSLDRDEAVAVLQSGEVAEDRLTAIRSELAEVGRHAILRTLLLGIAGGLGGGLLGGGLVGALLYRRRWLAYGAAVGMLIPLAYGGVVVATLRHVDYAAFEQPTFFAHGRELPRLLTVTGQLLAATESYPESYKQVLAGLARLIAFAREGGAPDGPTRSVVLASDLHANSLVLPVLDDFVRGKLLFWVGDFTLRGTKPERGLVPAISRLGRTAVAVSGNHDSRRFMLALADAGVIVLTREGRLLADGSTDGPPVVVVDGLRVAAFDDPLERRDRIEARPLELTDEEFAAASRDLVAWFGRLPERPDVVLVHQSRLARALLESISDGGPPVLILTGHDHEQYLEQSDSGVLVDGGTVGAGGPFKIGVEAAGFAVIHLAEDEAPDAVDLIEVEPLSGSARASRTVLGGTATDSG
jgi:predicted phosphodiesterase